MKRILYFLVAVLVLGLAAAAGAQEDSLGDYARKQKSAQKPASPNAKVWTNDDIASVPAVPEAKPADSKDKSKDAKDKDKDKSADKEKLAAEWKDKIAKQKDKIAETQRAIDVIQREYKLRSIEWYTQAGNALLDPKKWYDQQQKYEKEIADRQKELADQQAELEKMRDEIRKAGLSSSVGE